MENIASWNHLALAVELKFEKLQKRLDSVDEARKDAEKKDQACGILFHNNSMY